MNTFSFVVLNYNRYDLVHQVLFDIYKTCSPVEEVLVVNNGCTELESFSGLDWWRNSGMLPIRELRLEENVGFLRASNAGIQESTGDVICLISNDVRVRGDIVQRIHHVVKDNPKAMVGGRLLDWRTGWNNFKNTMCPYLEGWLLAATKDTWENIRYFDERFSPNDMEDVDISTTVLNEGGILVPLPEDITHHIGAQSLGYNPEREILTKINREKFREKWNLEYE